MLHGCGINEAIDGGIAVTLGTYEYLPCVNTTCYHIVDSDVRFTCGFSYVVVCDRMVGDDY